MTETHTPSISPEELERAQAIRGVLATPTYDVGVTEALLDGDRVIVIVVDDGNGADIPLAIVLTKDLEDRVVPMHGHVLGQEVKWFINEDGEPYDYPADRQEADFPNDFHTAYDTEAEALAAVEGLFA